MSAPLFELRDVSKVFSKGFIRRQDTTVAVAGATLSLPSSHASMTAIDGESGRGKTTLARMLLGVIEPTSGAILYKGVDLATMSRAERRVFHREVQPIFQDPFEVFNPFYRIDHVLEMPIRRFKLADSAK